MSGLYGSESRKDVLEQITPNEDIQKHLVEWLKNHTLGHVKQGRSIKLKDAIDQLKQTNQCTTDQIITLLCHNPERQLSDSISISIAILISDVEYVQNHLNSLDVNHKKIIRVFNLMSDALSRTRVWQNFPEDSEGTFEDLEPFMDDTVPFVLRAAALVLKPHPHVVPK